MSRADSPLRDRLMFAFGARRSGTWWLQRILTAHPEVAGIPSETYLFELGIRPLLERFHHGAKSSTTVGQMHTDRAALLDATRDFCDRMLVPYLEPGARYLSERSPGHAKALDVIGAVYPDARLIHIVRDGRDVARSLAARNWGPGSVGDAARDWRENVEAARAHAGDHYLEIRYEHLLDDLEGGIKRLYAWLELPGDDALVAEVAAQARRPLNEDPKDPRIASGKWRDHFSEEELAAFTAEAGELLAELDYADEPVRPATTLAPAPALARIRGRLAAGRHRVRAAPAAGDANGGWEVGGRLAVSQQLADQLLERLHAGDVGVATLLHPDVTLRIVTAEGETSFTGPAAAAEALTADAAWALPQVIGEAHPGTPRFSLAVAYSANGGGQAWRIIYLETREGLIGSLTIYGVSA